jgi:hypothetical protein
MTLEVVATSGTTITTIVIGATTEISTVIAMTTSRASVLAMTTTRSTPWKNLVGVAIMKKTMLKPLKGPCPAHPKSNHMLENCKVLKEIYHRKQASENVDKPNDATDQRNHRDDDEDDPDKNPKHQYQEPVRHVATIIGGKVSVESQRERKLLARACLNVAKTKDLICRSKTTPGHTKKSTSAGWINGPPSPN